MSSFDITDSVCFGMNLTSYNNVFNLLNIKNQFCFHVIIQESYKFEKKHPIPLLIMNVE